MESLSFTDYLKTEIGINASFQSLLPYWDVYGDQYKEYCRAAGLDYEDLDEFPG